MSDKLNCFLSDNYDADPLRYRINLFDRVRDFGYNIDFSKDIDTILSNQKGYCVSKHRLLENIYDRLGYDTRLCFIPFSFGDIYLPDDLKGRGMSTKKWYHVFLRLSVGGNWIDIDATFGKQLKSIYTVNENWDGISSQKIICDYLEVHIAQTQEQERQIKNKLTDNIVLLDDDYKWISKYNNWLCEFYK